MKIMITLSEAQTKALFALMAEDTADNKSAYVARLIGDETKRRRERHDPKLAQLMAEPIVALK